MLIKIGTRFVCLFAGAALLSACQGIFPGDEDASIGALRLNQAQAVASTQRLDEDGYPMLGAYPSAAAPQLSDNQVQATENQFNALARNRANAPSNSPYAANIQRSRAARQRQAATARQAAAQPTPPAARRAPNPDDVLRQIEASGQATN